MGVSTDTIYEMRFKRGKLISDGRDLIDKARQENREISAEERAKYQEIWTSAEDLNTKIQMEERQRGLEKTVQSDIENLQRNMELEARGKKPDLETMVPGELTGDALLEQRAKLAKELEAKHELEYRNKYRGYLAGTISGMEVRALQKDVNTAGGYLVAPETFVAELLKDLDNSVVIRSLARKYSLEKASSLGYPRLRTKMSAASRTGELQVAAADTAMDFGKRAFFPNPASAQAVISKDLRDMAAINVESEVRSELNRVMGELEENEFMIGTGLNKQALGLFTPSSDGIDTSRDISTGNLITGVKFDGLKRVKRALKAGYLSRAKWLFHNDILLQISLEKDSTGNYIWEESTQIGDPDKILGIEVIQSWFAPNTIAANAYVGMLGAFDEYQIVDVLTMTIEVLDQLYALSNQIGFLARWHFDGGPRKAEAFARVQLPAS